MHVASRLLRSRLHAVATPHRRVLSTDVAGPQNFDIAEKARIFSNFFDEGKPMWSSMLELAHKEMPAGP